jgi:hypothetical protein
MTSEKITKLGPLYEQIREISTLLGVPESEPRTAIPHTYQGIQEELQNIRLYAQDLLLTSKARGSDISTLNTLIKITEAQLNTERLSNRQAQQKLARSEEIQRRYQQDREQ